MAIARTAIGDLVANIVLPILATVGVALRFLARTKKGQPLKLDDYTILFALILCLGLAAAEIYAACTGLVGVPWDNLESYEAFRKIQFADIIICHVVYGFTKISVVLFYKRIFTLGRTTIVMNALLWIISLFLLVTFFTVLFCSKGVSSFWTTPPQLDGTQYYMVPGTLVLAYAILDIVLDIAVLSTPLPAILRLNLSPRTRLGIVGVFLLGAFCLVCSCVRLYYANILLQFFAAQSKTYQAEMIEDNILWAHIEAYASTFAACLPTLPPLFREGGTFNSFFNSIRSTFSLRSASRNERSQNAETQIPPPKYLKASWFKTNSLRVGANGAAYPNTRDLEAQSQNSDASILRQELEMQRLKGTSQDTD
ncbi:hypothetical protein F5Y13DRAFT_175585, partial [Hypoxylon sp. FL1857]